MEPTSKKKTDPNELVYRDAEFIRKSLDEDKREIELSFSSEDPVQRFDYMNDEMYNEVLDHAPGSVRLERINKGGALLVDHDRSSQVGVTVRAWIDEVARKGRAVVRFSKSNAASEIYQDVVDEIRQNVSVGYKLNGTPEKSDEDGTTVYRFNDWEPQEISIVSVPADVTVGVGRSQEEKPKPKVKIMEPTEDKLTQMELEKAKAEGKKEAMAEVQIEEKRKKDILALGEGHSLVDFAREHAQSGTTVEAFRTALLEKIKTQPVPTSKSEVGLSKKETDEYRILDVIRAQLPGADKDPKYGLVYEASRAIAEQLGRTPEGIFVPNEIQQQRDLSVGTDAQGGYTVGTDLMGQSFIELLRNMMVTQSIGATVFDGLVGDVAIPRHSAAGTAYWISSEAGAITESHQTLEQVTLTPKTVAAFTDMTRKLINQSSIDVEGFVRADLAKILAIAIDLACFDGTGASGQPTGISEVSGIGTASWTATGAPTFAEIVSVETAVAVDNALAGSLAYVANGTTRGKLKTVDVSTSTGQWVWQNDQMNGYPAHLSNQLTDYEVFFGNWNDLLIGFWGTLDVLVDPYTGSTTGNLRVRCMKDCDVAARHAQSFALGANS